jgi:hypothetical protein
MSLHVLPADVWRLIFLKCRGYPVRHVCRASRRWMEYKKLAPSKMVSSIALLSWARDQGCPWDEMTCAYAAQNGNLEVLQWLRAQGCPWDEMTCAYAASKGHLKILQWARARGCPWDEWTYAYAARGGHLEVVQWARANGCPESQTVPVCSHLFEYKKHCTTQLIVVSSNYLNRTTLPTL